jgi:hypothetical protein
LNSALRDLASERSSSTPDGLGCAAATLRRNLHRNSLWLTKLCPKSATAVAGVLGRTYIFSAFASWFMPHGAAFCLANKTALCGTLFIVPSVAPSDLAGWRGIWWAM